MQIQYTFTTLADLSASYLTFIKHGGLFIKINPSPFSMGSNVNLTLTLPQTAERFCLNARIVWITPLGAQGANPAGIGVQLPDSEELLKKTIETLLASES